MGFNSGFKGLIFQYISNKTQRYTVYFIWKLLYIFRVVPSFIIRNPTTVSTAPDICHTVMVRVKFTDKVYIKI